MKKFLKISMDESLHQSSKEKAKELGISLSELVRQFLKNGKVIQKNNNKDLVYHLNKIGNNINQIARKINSEKSYRAIDSTIYTMLVKVKKDIEILVYEK